MVILAAEINGLFLKAGEWRCGFSEGAYYRDLWPVRRVEPDKFVRFSIVCGVAAGVL